MIILKLFASHKSPQIGTENVSLLQGETNKLTMTVGDLQTPLSGTDRLRVHKNQ